MSAQLGLKPITTSEDDLSIPLKWLLQIQKVSLSKINNDFESELEFIKKHEADLQESINELELESHPPLTEDDYQKLSKNNLNKIIQQRELERALLPLTPSRKSSQQPFVISVESSEGTKLLHVGDTIQPITNKILDENRALIISRGYHLALYDLTAQELRDAISKIHGWTVDDEKYNKFFKTKGARSGRLKLLSKVWL